MANDWQMSKEKLIARIVLSENPGKEMKKIRLELGTTQKELAERLGITQSTLSDYEAGRRPNLGVKIVKRFVGKLDFLI